VFTVAFDASAPSPHLLRLRLTDQQNQVLSENVYWRYREAQDMQALSQLPEVPLSASVRRAGENQVTATLRNNGSAVAAMVVLSLRDRDSGQRILPARYSENYLWLLPGETRDVTVSWRSGREPAVPEIVVSGYNVRA
jgi:Ig-like domain-containing protein